MLFEYLLLETGARPSDHVELSFPNTKVPGF